MPREFFSPAELKEWVGREVGSSDWIPVSQAIIDQFAEATGDHQWIHVDVPRAQAETPFKSTIAHGFLTLSLLSQMLPQVFVFKTARMGLNYGLNKLRFTAPVPSGSRVRGHFVLKALEDFDGGVQMTWGVTVEVEGSSKPCLVAEWLTRRYN
jgi:acyl dehydratase